MPDSLLHLPASDRSYQGIRDTVQSGRHRNEIAQRHRTGARLSRLLPVDRDQVEAVTSALSIPANHSGPASPRVSPEGSEGSQARDGPVAALTASRPDDPT